MTFDSTFFFLFTLGFCISLVSFLVGAVMPLYMAIMQAFFPHLTIGNIVGANKIHFLFGEGAGIAVLWKKIDWKFLLKNSIPFTIGTLIGVQIIANLSMKWVFPLLILAFIISEFAPRITPYFTKTRFTVLEGFLGIYTGLLGAAIKPTLLSVFRLKETNDEKIIYLKIQISALTLFTSVFAAIAHYLHGNLLPEIVLPLSIGGFFGGILGGFLMRKMEKFSPAFQKNFMRASFLVALASSAWMAFFS